MPRNKLSIFIAGLLGMAHTFNFREADGGGGHAATDNPLIEAIGGDKAPGSRYKIRVIKSGLSKNNVFYPDRVLREATKLLEGVRVYVKPDAEHLSGGGKSFAQLLGRLSKPTFIEGSTPNTGEIQAEFDVLQSAGEVASKMYEAFSRGMGNIFGFSIDAVGSVTRKGNIREAQQISKFASVDLIIEPGAGGELIGLIEAAGGDDSYTDVDGTTETASFSYRQAPTFTGNGLPDTMQREFREAMQQVKMAETRAQMREAIADCKLPDVAKDKLRARFSNQASYTFNDVMVAIAEERDYLARMTESGMVQMGDRVEPGEQQFDKLQTMWDDFFDRSKPAMSLKECYIQTTGDKEFTGRMPRTSPLREALDSTSFADVLGDSMNRRLLEEYRHQTNLDSWRGLTGAPQRLNDFRKREATRFGGYGDLPIVAEGADYTALTSPTDEKAEYQGSKRGGTETITLEMIRNDDMGAVQRIPVKMNRSAKRTLSKFVFNFLMGNPAIYDGTALFHGTHSNLGAAALNAASLAAARQAVMKQTEPGSNEPIFIPPSHLWVPADLEETAFDLFRRQTNNDTDFIESLQMSIHPVWCFTDANNWYASVNPDDIPIIEIGFLDGREEPEMFVQDDPRTGSMFTNDKLTYKIRHIYGAAVVDYRGIYGAIVA